ncbi:DNA topoisomerase [Pseudomonas kitaguniensis]|uniref:type IA DNA topoisomerase n=1 Tax=Pseudomonas kitaguniensis TaxID=2607908 RepID=UPI003B9FECC3
MRVFIAEKPQLAQVIAEGLGNARRDDGFFVSGNDVVTWCIGHLLELAPPEVHNPAYANWDAADLPLKLRPIKYQPIARTASQLKIVAKLISQASEIVHAGDPDDEGQLLVDEVLEHYGNRSPVKRILINDMNANAARKALGQLRDNSEFYGLYQKALARSVADQLYGFNMTRAYTLAAQARGMKGVLPVGRVQTVILGLIVNRYLANRSHSAAYYYNVTAAIRCANGAMAKAKLMPANGAPVDEKNRIIDQSYVDVLAQACSNSTAVVGQVSNTQEQTPAPLPFALLDLQVLMSGAHGIDSEKTLSITQALRDKYQAITYNRSDCNYLSDEQFGDVPATLNLLSRALPEWAGIFTKVEPHRKSRAFDDSKISAHTAIIPTAKQIDIEQLTADEKTVYLAIVKRYLVQFLPPKLFQKVVVNFGVADQTFISQALKVTHAGWTVLENEVEEEDENDEKVEKIFDESDFELLAGLTQGSIASCNGVTVTKEKTRPPAIYSEGSLLKDLKRVAKYVTDPRIKQLLLDRDKGKKGEHGGIGTPATRASMLTKLRERGLYEIVKKKFVPTPLGLEFVAALPSIATSPDMTALWHEQQLMIEAGELTVDAFLDELELFIKHQVSHIDLADMQIASVPTINALCPMCGKDLAVTTKLIACRSCTFRFYPEIARKTLTFGQIELLLTKGKTGVLKGFKTKAGKPFDAALRLNHEAKVEFISNR